MKRFYLSIALLVALLAGILPASFVAADDGEGNPVSPDVAKQVAANLLNTMNLRNIMQNGLELAKEPIEPKLDDSSVSEVFVETKNGKDVYYIINMNPEGWVIISADYVAYPIIGCSDTGSYSPENHPPAFDSWMENVKEEIYQAITEKITPLEEATEAWQVLNAPTKDFLAKESAGSGLFTLTASSAGPLLSTNWGQGGLDQVGPPAIWALPWLCSEDYYCPWERNWAGFYQVAPTGCGATAAGQVMKYWEWPSTGEGSYTWNPPYDACCENTYGPYTVDYAAQTYNWAIMPNNVRKKACSSSSTGDKEVAKLLRHVGNAMDTDYKPGGSTSNSWYALCALETYFRYDYSAYYEDRDSTSYDDWAVKLREELDAGRPIFYRGGGGKVGHAFVCDGYGILDLFHFNWGWDGLLDGWYWLSALTTLNGNFTADQGGIFDLKPDYPPIAETDAYTVNENNTLNVGAPGVLGNDSNPLGGPITAVKDTNPSNGTLSLDAEGSFTYKPKANFHGTDSFNYHAYDGRYNSDTTKVTITVNAVNEPPVAEAGGPYTGIEGSPVAFTGSGTDIDGDALKYRWDFEKDGTWDTGWSDSGTASQTWDDDWTGTAMVQASDSELTAEDTASVTIENVAPTCVAGPDQSQYWGLPVNFDGTVSDPSIADTEFGLQPTWIFGDGDTAAGLSVTHIYADPDLYTAELTATDKDGGVGSDTAQVTVNKREATLSYTGDTTAVFGYATLSAQLSDAVDPATAQLNGRTVLFTIDGSTIAATTNSQGIATASPIPIIPGDYQVGVAFAEGSHYLASSAQGTLSVTISAGKVTAGVTEVANKGRGGFNVQSDGTTVKGELQFKDDMDKYHASEMTALGIALDGKSAWFAGVGKDGRQFIAYVEDNGEPKTNDVFKLWIEGTLHNSDGTLEGGNIQIHK